MMKQQEDGYVVLLTVLILGAVVTVIAGFLLLTGQNASISSVSVVGNTNAKAAATGCAELGLSAILANTSSPTPATANQTVNATTGATCTYTITGTSPNYTVSVTGTVSQGTRTFVHRMTLTTNQVTPQINVSSWQDSP
jgi:hypothetical protein